MRRMHKLLLATTLLLLACQDGAASSETSAPTSLASRDLTAMPGETKAQGQALPEGHPPIEPAGLPAGHPPIEPGTAPAGGATKAVPTEAPVAGGLTWSTSAPLERRAPKTSMRAAEYGVAGGASAELTVSYFGPSGGGVDPNIDRWIHQFTQPDGSDSAKKAKRAERKVAGFAVTSVEVTGSYSGGMGMGAGPGGGATPEGMLLGAIVVGPEGPVFFKLTGEKSEVERARGAFDAMIGSVQPAAAAPAR